MPVKASPRILIIIVAALAIFGFTFVHLFHPQAIGPYTVSHDLSRGGAIMPHLGNETAKAELGRATWKYFHTVMARYPEKPTADERATLKQYVHLFQRLYPCGECSEHFGQILERYPPQTSSRSAAATWACHVHNEVNESLKKELFDCSKIGDFYDCGCAEDEPTAAGTSGAKSSQKGG